MRQLSRAAFVQSLRDTGTTIRGSAALMRCSPGAAQRLAKNGSTILPLRSRKLAIPYVRNLLLLLSLRNHTFTVELRRRLHGGKVSRMARARKPERSRSARPPRRGKGGT